MITAAFALAVSGITAPAQEVATETNDMRVAIERVPPAQDEAASLWASRVGISRGLLHDAATAAGVWVMGDVRLQVWAAVSEVRESGGGAGSVPSVPRVQSGQQHGDAAVADFSRGYQDAGGDPALLPHVIEVVDCESSWQLDPGNPDYWGLGQFVPSTWYANARAGASWMDPYEQGWAMATLIGKVDPGSTGGWPVCWWVGGW